MTTTTELRSLAKDPFAFDTKLAALHVDLDKARAELTSRMNDVYKAAGARRVSTRQGVRWDASYDAAHAKVRESGDQRGLLARVSEARFTVTDIELEIRWMDEVYAEAGHRWTRFFPSVTKSQPHIHRSLGCRTLHPTTVMTWAPQLSGKTDEQAVAELDEALCSVCFPTAPVALHNYVSRKSQAEQAARLDAKSERAAKALAKNLDGSEIFRSRRHDRITTVAACKELIRDAIEAEVELEWIMLPARETEGTFPADMLARMRTNRADILLEAQRDAGRAAAILNAREAAHEGWGATMAEVTKMQQAKYKSARKEWFK